MTDLFGHSDFKGNIKYSVVLAGPGWPPSHRGPPPKSWGLIEFSAQEG